MDIEDKNKEPVPTKTETTDGTAGIGSKVEYSVTITNAGDVDTLVYHDTMTSGLAFNQDVSIEGMTVNTDYTVSTSCSDGCTFEVTFTENGLAKITDSVTITYSATVNANAVETNGNEGKVTYGDAGTSTTTKTETKVYDFDLTNANGSGEPLTVSFTLANSNGNLIQFVPVTGGYRVATSSDDAEDITTTITAGTVNIFGLDAGTYTLTETAAPSGYNQLTSAITVTIDQNGGVSISENDDNVSATDGAVKVVNNAGTSLPTTGGIGTTIFYIVGGVLVLGAAVLLITRKRMSNAK